MDSLELDKPRADIFRVALSMIEQVLDGSCLALVMGSADDTLMIVPRPGHEAAVLTRLAEVKWQTLIRIEEEHRE